MSQPPHPVPLWELPDTVLFHLLQYVAPPTHRATVLCHSWALLCRAAHSTLLCGKEGGVWEILLRQDYGVLDDNNKNNGHDKSPRRSCKRLRRSVQQRVQRAHQLMHDNTEIAFYYLTEESKKVGGLTKAKLRSILDEYGPLLRINHVVSSGGTFLVQVCRAVYDNKRRRGNHGESTVLACVKLLVEDYGALVDGQTYEAASCQQTALGVVAARGMPSVVRYLLERGASPTRVSSGRMATPAKRATVKCVNATPLLWAESVYQAARAAGTPASDLTSLHVCMELLRRATTLAAEN